MKNNWKNTWQYKRIIEILEEYWLREPEEDYVRVDMYFRKGNEEQAKCIQWTNPNKSNSGTGPIWKTVSDIIKN